MHKDAFSYNSKHHHKLLDTFYLIGRIRELLFGGRSIILLASAHMPTPRSREVTALYLSELETAVEAAGLPWEAWEPAAKTYITSVRRSLLRAPTTTPRKHSGSSSAAKLETLIDLAKQPIVSALETIPPSLEKAETAAAHL